MASKNVLQKEIDALKAALEAANQMTMDDRNKELANQVELLSADVTQLTESNVKHAEKMAELEEVNNDLLETENVAIADLTAKVTALEDENAELLEISGDEMIEKLTAEKATLASRVVELETAPPAASAAINLASIKGFILEVDDPFAEGALRTYMSAGKNPSGQAARVPFVLPFNDKATVIALDSYIVRAEGGCDTARAEAARKIRIVKYGKPEKKKKTA